VKNVTTSSGNITRYGRLPVLLKGFFFAITTFGLALSIYMIFGLRIGDFVFLDAAYFYLLFACFLPGVFLILPARKKDKDKHIPVYDILAAVLMFGISVFFALNAWEITQVGWSHPSGLILVAGIIWLLLSVESARRGGGAILATLCLLFGIYPLVSVYMPSVFFGPSQSFQSLISFHVFNASGLPGLMAKVLGYYLVGFLLFSGMLIAFGCGEFFINLATALMGKYRGGPAKVSILASMLFGTLSGSSVSNVVATGTFTIPIMKRIGYPPEYAGAIEACASTGGMLMPPIMGTVVFMMAAMLEIEYRAIMVAAVIPAVLYYFGLLVQSDIFAAKIKMRGLLPEECPNLKKVLKNGWSFLFVIVFLIWGLMYMQWEMKTPYYTCLLMMAISFLNREKMMTPKRLIEVITSAGRLITQLSAILLPVGLILSGLQATGVGFSLASELVNLGGGNIFLVLLFGMIACYILGMAGMITPAYIFLSVSMAPAAIKLAGLNEMATHFFIVYYAVLAGITPPVAMAAFIGAAIAGSKPMKTAFVAARMGFVIYIIPFFFIFNPSLILQGSLIETLYLVAFCLVGLTIFAFGLEGYIYRVGRINLLERLLMIFAGFLIAFPNTKSTIAGVIIALVAAIIIWAIRRGASYKTDLKYDSTT
jgi:TRAP transporter 4TM/12TM fusion protein